MFARSVPLSHSERSTLFAHILRLALVNRALLCADALWLPASSVSAQQEASSSSTLTTGAIVGIVIGQSLCWVSPFSYSTTIGIAVFVIIVAVLVFLAVRRRRRKSRSYALMPEASGPSRTLAASPPRTNRMHGTHHSVRASIPFFSCE